MRHNPSLGLVTPPPPTPRPDLDIEPAPWLRLPEQRDPTGIVGVGGAGVREDIAMATQTQSKAEDYRARAVDCERKAGLAISPGAKQEFRAADKTWRNVAELVEQMARVERFA